jgi:NTE family protein
MLPAAQQLFIIEFVLFIMKKITVALGGGGLKGFAHIGVLRQLEKEGYQIAAVAGTSVGGIIGALYACGYSTFEIEALAEKLKFPQIFNRDSNDAPSLIGLQGLYKLLSAEIGDKTFADTRLPFAVTAVDSQAGREVILDSGKLITAIKATIAIPGIFPSVKIKKMNLVDGGVLDPVPVSVARWLNSDHPIVAVSLMTQLEHWQDGLRVQVPSYVPIPEFIVHQISQLRLSQAMQVFIDSTDIMSNMIAELRLRTEKPDVLIRPAVYKYSLLDMVDLKEAISLGEQAVKEEKTKIDASFMITNRMNRWLRPSYLDGKLLSEVELESPAADD